eukprot:scaffold45596_cov58-Attheya_sp.AAC.6
MDVPLPTRKHTSMGMRILDNDCSKHQNPRIVPHEEHSQNPRHLHAKCRSPVNHKRNGKKRIQQHNHNGEHDQEKTTYLDRKTCETTGKQTTKTTSSHLGPKSEETRETSTHTQEHNGKSHINNYSLGRNGSNTTRMASMGQRQSSLGLSSRELVGNFPPRQ